MKLSLFLQKLILYKVFSDDVKTFKAEKGIK